MAEAPMLTRAWWGRFRLVEEQRLPSSSPETAFSLSASLASHARLLKDIPRTWRSRLRPSYAQRTILMLMAAFAALYALAAQWRPTRILLYPFAIASTVFHEFGHAAATVLTGGRVLSVSVALDESGLTRFVGGWRCAILPAGYVGSSSAGAVLLFAAFGPRAATWAAGGVLAVMAATLFLAADLSTVISCVALAALLVFAVSKSAGRYARHAISVLGVVCSLHAVVTILQTTVFATIEGSDAVEFARTCSVLVPAFVYGLLWLLISLCIVALSLCLAIIVFD